MMNEQRRFDEDDARIGPAPVAEAPEPEDPAPASVARRTERVEAAGSAPRRSGSGRILTALLLLLAGGAGALIGGPKLAPMLPAPVAAWLMPAGQGDTSALRASLTAEIDALRGEIGQARTAVASAEARAAEALRRAETAAQAATASGGTADTSALDNRIAALERALADLRGDVEDAVGERDSTLRNLRADIAALDTRVANAPAFTAPADLEDLRARLATLEAALASDVSVRQQALAEAERARRAAAVTAILSDIDRAMAFGRPFPDALDALRDTADVAVPPVLETAARTGVPTPAVLVNDFGPAAHRAVTEALAARADGEGGVGEVIARVQARFTGIPTEPVEGSSPAAILSRVRHQLENGDLDAALAGVSELPETAQGAMAVWVEDARLRAGAEAALAALRAEIDRGY